MIGIIGRKLGMTQIFNEAGQQVPVTVVVAEPNPVLQVFDKEQAGFAAVRHLACGFSRPWSLQRFVMSLCDPARMPCSTLPQAAHCPQSTPTANSTMEL